MEMARVRARAALLFILLLTFITIAASSSSATDKIMEIEARMVSGRREKFEAEDGGAGSIAGAKRRGVLTPPSPRANSDDSPDPPVSSKPVH